MPTEILTDITDDTVQEESASATPESPMVMGEAAFSTAQENDTSKKSTEEEEVQEVQEKAGKRLQGTMKDALQGMMDGMGALISRMKDMMTWASYADVPAKETDDKAVDLVKLMKMRGAGATDEQMVTAAADMGMDEDKAKAMVAKWAEVASKGDDVEIGFKVYYDKSGNLRWVSRSANAFKDREGEIFKTKALEDAVESADKSGERGPLMIWHVKGTEIGACDFQAMLGRFLVESGTFDSTPQGTKAATYFAEHGDTPWEMSIGYAYRATDRADSMYDWLEYKERSICPPNAAMNPWTQFTTTKEAESEMALNETKKAFLESVLGPEFVATLVTTAEEDSKALETKVAYKADEAMDTKAMTEALSEAIKPLLEGVKASNDAVAALQAELSTAKARLDQMDANATAAAEKAANAPRFASYMHQRPSSNGPIVSKDEAEKAEGAMGTENPNHPLNQRVGISR